MIACKVDHALPPGISWGRVLMKEQGKYPAVSLQMVPVLCNQCNDAACVKVCPTGATRQREDGIVTIDADKCIGCRYCMMACPYGARSFLDKSRPYFEGSELTPYEEIGYRQWQKGVVLKCNFCEQKLDDALAEGLTPGADRAATPACVTSCTGKARFFGDLDDPGSEVSQLIRSRRGKQLHPEFGTEPSVYYLD
ncbi:4Fe-4S dicluster domain-containing protein [Chloroflexota bacterium]